MNPYSSPPETDDDGATAPDPEPVHPLAKRSTIFVVGAMTAASMLYRWLMG